MKKNDIALIILIASISLVVSYLLAQLIIGSPGKHHEAVEVVTPISSEVTQPDSTIFNKDALNPSVPVSLGGASNQQPFNQSQ